MRIIRLRHWLVIVPIVFATFRMVGLNYLEVVNCGETQLFEHVYLRKVLQETVLAEIISDESAGQFAR